MITDLLLQGLIYFAILPTILLTAALITCESSRPQRKPIKGTKSDRKDKTDNSQVKKQRMTGDSGTKFTDTTESVKTEKSVKSLKRKLGKMKKSPEMMKLGSSTKSIEKVSSKLKRSSRKERFRKRKTDDAAMETSISSRTEPVFTYTNGSIACNINEKPKQGLKIEPKSLNWNISGGIQKVYLTNPSDERRAIKVKCSDNHLYRVSRVFTFVEPGEMVNIDVVRQNGGAKTDKMIFLWTKAEQGVTSASDLFGNTSPYPMLVLPLTVNTP